MTDKIGDITIVEGKASPFSIDISGCNQIVLFGEKIPGFDDKVQSIVLGNLKLQN
jgi:hypothetical protein